MERLSRMKAWAHVAVLTCAALLAGCTGDAAGNAGVTTSAVGTPEPVATHVVVRGETLFEISRDTGVSIETLVELNEIPDANVIEVEQVLALEPPREPAASAVEPPSSEEPTDPVLAWFRVRWDQLPRPTVSDRAVSEGAIAALMVPAVVFALLLVWLLALGSRRVVLGAARGVGWLGASLPIPPPGGSVDGDTEVDADASIPVSAPNVRTPRVPWRGRSRQRSRRARVPALLSVGLSRVSAGVRVLGGHVRAGVLVLGGHVSALARRAVRASTVGLRERGAARAEQRRERELLDQRAALRDRWWRAGTEALRIGLLDEAELCFVSGLEAAESEDWAAEVRLFQQDLELVRERRSFATSAASLRPAQLDPGRARSRNRGA